MRVFIQNDSSGRIANINFSVAYHGFDKMGWEIVHISETEELIDQITSEDIFVGYVEPTKRILDKLSSIEIVELSYPTSLKEFLGRRIWKGSYHQLIKDNESGIFIKPANENKLFTGRLVRGMKDLIDIGHHNNDIELWCSEPVKFLSEARCFVRYGEILDIRKYKGSWKVDIDYSIVEKAVEKYVDQPAGFAMDFGKTSTGETIVVEVNDGYSLGAYGLFSVDYCKLLSARWSQIMGTNDYCNF